MSEVPLYATGTWWRWSARRGRATHPASVYCTPIVCPTLPECVLKCVLHQTRVYNTLQTIAARQVHGVLHSLSV